MSDSRRKRDVWMSIAQLARMLQRQQKKREARLAALGCQGYVPEDKAQAAANRREYTKMVRDSERRMRDLRVTRKSDD